VSVVVIIVYEVCLGECNASALKYSWPSYSWTFRLRFASGFIRRKVNAAG